MKFLIAAVLAAASTFAAANGRCLPPNPTNGPDCRPPVPVLIYHRVTTEHPPSQTVISPRMFTLHMDRIQRMKMNTITVQQLEAHIRRGAPLPPNPILLTFDDGWKDNLAAAENLAERGMKATFYLLSGAFDSPMYVSKTEARQIAATHEIGAHSHTHFMEWENDMSKADDRVLIGEVAMSKAIIEQVIGREVTSFAWPFGYFREHLLAKLPSIGITSAMHVNADFQTTDTLRIHRLNIDGGCGPDDLETMIRTAKFKECR
jgi:peptidoglycan/xylan/chitin deacetylase (PgdA/CDA1 family)